MAASLETRIRVLEQQLELLRRELNRQAGGPAKPLGRRDGYWYGVFTTSVSQGGTGTFELCTRTDGAWVRTGRTITATDWFLSLTESIPANAKGRVSWYQPAGVFVPDIWTCEASDTLPGSVGQLEDGSTLVDETGDVFIFE